VIERKKENNIEIQDDKEHGGEMKEKYEGDS
jgi:hypothetical protein